MNGRSTRKISRKTQSRTDWARIDAMTDEDIDYSDSPATTKKDWKDAKWVQFVVKAPVSMRIDDDILCWFKSRGRGYQTRMNAVLRAYMEHQTRKGKRRSR